MFLEAKYRDAEFPTGQRILLERIARDAERAGKEAISIVCEHDVSNPQDDIYIADARVREFFWRGSWRARDCDVRSLVSSFIRWCETG